MSDDLRVPSFLRPEGRRRVCMFSIMVERGRRADEFRKLGVETVFCRLGDGRHGETEADMMRGWLGHMAHEDPYLDVSERMEQIDARYALGRRRHHRGVRLAHMVRVGWPVLPLLALLLAALFVTPGL